MPVSCNATIFAGPSVLSSQMNGASVAEPQSGSRRNSFDMVIAVANERAANDALAESSTEVVPEANSGMSTFETFEPRCPITRRAAASYSQAETFEDIELQEWPTASRLAALNSDIAASTVETPPPSPKHTLQLPAVSQITRQGANVPPRSLLAKLWSSGSEPSLWEDMVTVLGAIRASKSATQ